MISQREIRIEIPVSKQASERTMESRKTHPAWRANRARRKRQKRGAGKRERASNLTPSRRQSAARVSLFFINRLIEQGYTPPDVLFHPALSLHLFLAPCPGCLLSAEPDSPSGSFLEPPVSLFRHPLSPLPKAPSRCRRGAPFVTRSRGNSHFAILFNFFRRKGIPLLPGRVTSVFSGQ